MLQPDEKQQLEQSWKKILILWGVFFVSLVIYLVFGVFLSSEGITIDINTEKLPLPTIKYALFTLSVLTVVAVYFVRFFLLRPGRAKERPEHSASSPHSAVAQYTKTVILTSALLETIAFYGLVFFLFSGDLVTFCLFLGSSALARLPFRPRKQELLDLAAQMKKP